MTWKIDHNFEPEDLHQQLSQIVEAACEHPSGSLKRQQLLNYLVYQMQQSGKIWSGWGSVDDEDYEEALQQTWLWFCQNISKYNPTKASVITWFNINLKYTLQDVYIKKKKELATKETNFDQELDPIDILPASEEPPRILEQTLQWIETEKQLSNIHLCKCPQINCQILLLHRLSPQEKTWQALAQELGVKIGTLTSFYSRKCLPCLLAYGKAQGYIDT